MTRWHNALAPAKVNIGLEVVGRRDDGYHEVVTILQTVSIFDRFSWRSTGEPLFYRSPQGIHVDTDLVRRALASSGPRFPSGVLRLEKNIPVSAGLGGGSSNAALALRLAHPDSGDDELEDLAAKLGSDVPFFVRGGTALATGTGTTLTPITAPSAWCVIVSPHFAIPSKTQTLYRSLNPNDFTAGQKVREHAVNLERGFLPASAPPNAFERALRGYDAVSRAFAALDEAGAPWVSVSGAGPSVFTMVLDYALAASIAEQVSPANGQIFVARTVPANAHTASIRTMAASIRDDHAVR